VEAEVEGMAVAAEHRMPWAAAAISAVAARLEPLAAAVYTSAAAAVASRISAAPASAEPISVVLASAAGLG